MAAGHFMDGAPEQGHDGFQITLFVFAYHGYLFKAEDRSEKGSGISAPFPVWHQCFFAATGFHRQNAAA